MSMKQIVILGATGSIGQSTLAVLNLHPQDFQVLGISAHSRMVELATLVVQFKSLHVAVPDTQAAAQFIAALPVDYLIPTIHLGEQGLCDLATLPLATHVIAAIVGAAGLPSCIAAAQAGKIILLANKEALVMAGSFFLQVVRDGNATLLPLDSEHNALFQCLPAGKGLINPSVRSVWLTASGGPFLNRNRNTLYTVTPDEACKHPKWSMGRKISVDSATLMNKGLEVIEAALLYGLPAEQIKVAIHPQSTIHALVQYVDGSLLAHLSHPDMRVPITHALAYPERLESGVADLDMGLLADLQFSTPDTTHFPCLGLAYEALMMGQHGCIALNAANEIAVTAFLAGQLPFTKIAYIVAEVLKQAQFWLPPDDLVQVYALDKQARVLAQAILGAV